MREPLVLDAHSRDGAPAQQRPLGVWLLTMLDVLVLGVLTMVLAGSQIVALLCFAGPTSHELGYGMIQGTLVLVIALYGIAVIFGCAICLAARGAWLGQDRARVLLVVLVTMNVIVAASVNGLAVLGSVVLAPIQWWYFWRPSTLAVYD